MKKGTVYLVGAGPGDSGLITVKGLERLKSADVVVYDHLLDESLLDIAPPGAERIYVGKSAGRHALKQDDINRLLVQKSLEGKRVVRLKGGDPFVFGRGGEEAEFLVENGVDFEVVPGVTSAVAVPAYAGIPVTHRGWLLLSQSSRAMRTRPRKNLQSTGSTWQTRWTRSCSSWAGKTFPRLWRSSRNAERRLTHRWHSFVRVRGLGKRQSPALWQILRRKLKRRA